MLDTPPWGFTINDSLVVQSVEPGGKADCAGFKAGLRMREFNGTSIADSTHFEALIAENKRKESDETYPPVRFSFTFQVRTWGRVDAGAAHPKRSRLDFTVHALYCSQAIRYRHSPLLRFLKFLA